MKKKKIKLSFLILLVLSFAILAGCTSTKMSDDFDEKEVEERAKEVLGYLRDEDGESIREISNVEMKKALTDETMDEIFEQLREAGDFKEIQDISTGGHIEKSNKEEFAVALIKTKYENKEITFNMTFTKEMKLAGLFYK